MQTSAQTSEIKAGQSRPEGVDMNIVESYWSAASRRLQEEVDTFNALIGHAGEQGKENEQSLVRLMERLLPRSLGIGTGIIIDSDGRRSKQMDIILYDAINQPTVLAQTSQTIFPVECTFLALEVKTTLDEDELTDCAEKKASITKLVPQGGRTSPHFCVLSYHAQASTLPTAARHIKGIDIGGRADLLCIVYSAILAGNKSAFPDLDEGKYRIGLMPLHQFDEEKNRISDTWDIPTTDEKGSYVLREGVRYQVTRTGRKNDQRIVAEPGRALLNFCALLLDMLARDGAIPQAFLTHYLQKTAQEAIDFS